MTQAVGSTCGEEPTGFDEGSCSIRSDIDKYIAKVGIEAPVEPPFQKARVPLLLIAASEHLLEQLKDPRWQVLLLPLPLQIDRGSE
ncbi:MAG: hypothetical protein HY021_03110 [Burkholderiales bacterium]|nr:hypothetical protein [Burkholderiales bacterium]